MRAFVRVLLGIAALLVPSGHRQEWREEWHGELGALMDAHRQGAKGLPTTIEFAVGAIPHAFWMRTEGWSMESVWQDLRFATRVLRRNVGFTFVAAVTLALGIGANASIFSLVNGLLFRAPAGIHEPENLVQIARSYDQAPRWDSWSWPALQLIAEEGRTLSGVAGHTGQAFTLGTGNDAVRVIGEEVTGNYFDVLGVRPALGRLLQPADDLTPGGHPVVVLSHDLWTTHFGANTGVLGDVIQIGNTPYEVVGVTPQRFKGVEAIGDPPALWVPASQHPGIHDELPFDAWGWSWINAVGRMAPGATFDEVVVSMDLVTTRLREADPDNEGIRVLVAEGIGLDPEARQEARGLAVILALIVGVVLLIMCTNVANLLLARAAGRRTEVGVRTALGAGRARLMQQLVAESMVLAVLATLLAVPVVLSADRFVPLIFPYALSVSVGADGRVFFFLASVGAAAGLLFGLAPAWATSRHEIIGVLREAGTTGGRTKTRLRDGLVIIQLALSLGLVASAALLGRSVMNAASATPGFDPSGLAVGLLDVQSTGRYTDEESRQLLARIVQAVHRVPGVALATIANSTPIMGGHARATVRPAGRDDVAYEAEMNVVGGDYFATMGIPLLRGRALGGLTEEPEQSVVVNEALAAMFWPGEDPIGKEIETDQVWRVVGLVPDVQMRSLRSAGRPGVYYALAHSSPTMVLHAKGESGRVPDQVALQNAVASVDAGIPMRVANLQEAIIASMGETRTIGALIAAFAGLALLLAAVGLYGLVSYGASQRVREMGIRVALGARPASLVTLVLGRGVGITLIGTVVGVGVATALARALQGLLFQVSPADPLVIGLSAGMLFTAATLAAWLPARRASRVDAAISLRD